MLSAEQARRFVGHYLAGADPRSPYASPLYGEHAGLPPTIIQVGSDEVLRDAQLFRKLRQARRVPVIHPSQRSPKAERS